MAKPPLSPELESLIEVFRDAREQLLNIITGDTGVGTKVYYNTILTQLETQLKRMEKQSAYYIQSEIPKEYKKNLDELYSYFKKNNLQMKKPSFFAQIHNDAIHSIANEMQYHIGQGLAQAGRQIERYLNDARDDILRQTGLKATAQKLATGSTVQDMKNNLIERLQNEGFMTVQYGQGKNAYQVSLDAYAQMVARSTTREAGNLARENQLIENGYDLVEMTTHYPTCDKCSMFQGRVYSLTGKDKRFPSLMETAFKSGYRNIHPNCRHVIVPWIEELQTDDEIKEMISKSNKDFKDIRSDAERGLYSKGQALNRQIRQDKYQYERYKARLGEDAPKSFHAFRKMKKAGGEKWEQLQKSYKNWLYSQDYSDIMDMKGKLSDYQARRWYITHDKNIPNLIDKTLPLEKQARQAFDLRDKYKFQARELMEDQEYRKWLDINKPNPSFEEILRHKELKYGLTGNEAYEDIVRSSQTTNKEYDKKAGVVEDEQD